MDSIHLKKLNHFDENLSLPFYGSVGAAGADICACFEDKEDKLIRPFERALIPTGLCFEIPSGFEMQVRPRSGLSLKTGIVIVNSPGTIDSDYRGELKIIVSNYSNQNETIKHGMRLAQLIVSKVEQPKFELKTMLSETKRSVNGFGSTGVMN